jgi:hypothetical protein
MSRPEQNIDYKLPQDAYVSFDALTLKDFIIKRLNTNENFTDQIYEGSNLSSIIDIIAYSYHVLMFYLNTTASESTFSQATLYENMNKIVNLVGYKPTGKQTSLCTLNATATSNLPVGNYTIRKYSYFLVDDIQYTFLKDYSFSKTTTSSEPLNAINDNVVLYQGTVEQYPVYTATGDEYETLPIVVNNIVDTDTLKFISNGTVSVYVKEVATNKYYQYNEVNSLYLANSTDRVFDVRLNENGNYEVKFGNGVFGKKLEEGDEVVIYYILSNNVAGVISKNAINGNKLFNYTTTLFETIYTDTSSDLQRTIVTNSLSENIEFTNPNNSSAITSEESVDEIRKNAPSFVSSNIRLVTSNDYKSFLSKNLTGVAQSIYIAANSEFLDGYINYFYNISVDPNKVNRVLLNQVNFADSCDFNNINVFVVPSFNVVTDSQTPEYLSTAFKSLIVDLTKDIKMISHEVVPRDPVYVTYRIGFSNKPTLQPNIAEQCKLVVVRENTNKIQKDTIRGRVVNVFKDFFEPSNNQLGQNISLSKLTSDILSIDGVKYIYTVNTAENIRFNGVSLIGWNPNYPNDDISILNQDTQLQFFKFPYLDYPQTISNYIDVIDE